MQFVVVLMTTFKICFITGLQQSATKEAHTAAPTKHEQILNLLYLAKYINILT